MLTEEQVQKFQSDGFSFEEIQDISEGLKNVKEGKTISQEIFWERVYSGINTKMKEQENV